MRNKESICSGLTGIAWKKLQTRQLMCETEPSEI